MLSSYNPEEMNDNELYEVSIALENYLKDYPDKVLGTLSGRRIQYLEYYEVTGGKNPKGFQDEVVYVGTKDDSDGTTSVYYLGMGWKDAVDERRLLVKDLSPEVIKDIWLTSKANEALRKLR